MGGGDLQEPPPPRTIVARQQDLPASTLPKGAAGLLKIEQGGQVEVESSLPADLPCGYHWLASRDGMDRLIIVAPSACVVPARQQWGWAAQLYASRSQKSWGFGDMADLRRLADWSAKVGAQVLLINPLHAVAPGLPQEASPYYPTSRRFRNPLYLRIEDVPGAAELNDELAALATAGRALNACRIIKRDRVYELKSQALEKIWGRRGRAQWSAAACLRFRREQGDSLRQFAIFCVLVEMHGRDWHTWPAEYQRPTGPAVDRVAIDAHDRVAFYEWLQWLVDEQLAAASTQAAIVQDLPIGVDPGGADAWMWQDILARDVAVGAPPDIYIPSGQNWGLPPWIPCKLPEAYYEPFIQTVRAVLRHAGGLRIDHVMGLFRLFWIPTGQPASAGAFVRYTPSDLLAILALESRRAGAFIVGEDLGTVEDAAREQLAAHGVLSYRVMWFEEQPPKTYPELALAAVTTHDLPTIAGMWTGSDLADLKKLGIPTSVEGVKAMRARLAKMTRLPDDAPVGAVVEATHNSLANAPSKIVTATLDDALAVAERPNMPGTTSEWPNWSLALPKPLEELEQDALVLAVAKKLSQARDVSCSKSDAGI